MALLPRVFGWATPNNAEYIDVLLPIQPLTCTNLAKSSTSAGLNVESTSTSESSISPFESDKQDFCTGLALPTDMVDNSEHADATWVARPRNKFNRCDHVRKYSSDGKRVRRGSTSDMEKSLSKQVTDPWYHLSREERLYWKEYASSERLDHTRRHPDYRYQPNKSSMSRRRQAHSSTNDSEAASSGREISPLQSPSISGIPHEHTFSMINPTPRRSSDAAVGDSSNQCLRSLDSLDWPSTTSNMGSPYNWKQNTPACTPFPLRLQIPVSSPSLNTPDSHSPSNFRTNISPSTSTSSSVSDWNGENIAYPCGSSLSPDISRLDLFRFPDFDSGLELPDGPADNTHTDASFGTPEEMLFMPPSSSLHSQGQQQQFFGNGLYQSTGNLWMSSSYSTDSDVRRM